MLQCAAFGVGYARSALFEDSVGLLGRWDALIRLEYILRILQTVPEARCVLCPYVLCEFVRSEMSHPNCSWLLIADSYSYRLLIAVVAH